MKKLWSVTKRSTDSSTKMLEDRKILPADGRVLCVDRRMDTRVLRVNKRALGVEEDPYEWSDK